MFLPLFLAAFAAAQLENGGFEGTLDGWGVQGSQVALSDDAYEGSNACLVTGRTLHWQGIFHSILGDLEVGKDYHFTAFVKLVNSGPRQMRLEIKQQDDGNEGDPRYIQIADATVDDTQWTQLQGGFTLHAEGQVSCLRLIVQGSYLDQSAGPDEFDFLVDSVQVTENKWRTAANDRIEQLRKRDVELELVDYLGNPATNHDVNVQQISHHFAFGSTLNDSAIRDYPLYGDFFKQHFGWASFEWGAQWYATEAVQGVEDYFFADFSLNFAKSNGIKMKGHALAYPTTRFLPDWLLALSPAEIQAELDERVTNILERYAGDVFAWDVSNELLDEDRLSEKLGSSTNAGMFQLAKQVSPDVALFTNEYSLTNSDVKTTRYQELVQGLLDDGADVGAIGLQSHFYDGFISPKAMELTISELGAFGIDLWFTEFDIVHKDPEVRADCLEDFYRYAFSRPEAKGIMMWGFWAGAHWRGPDAALVDLDWTINAQGQRYLDLIDQWTTSLESNSGAEADIEFRGFHGNYLVTTVHPVTAVTNYHLIVAEPGTDPLAVTLVTNLTDGSLSIYGTPGDDLFEFDLETKDRVDINGQTVWFDLPTDLSTVRFVGLGGDDRLETLSRNRNQHFRIREELMAVIGSGFRVEYDQIESAYFYSRLLGSTVTFVDSAGDDTLTSYHEETTLQTPNIELIADNFRYLFCRSTAGNDAAWLFDTPQVDQLYTDLDIVSLRWGSRNRRVWDFAETNIVSTEAADIGTFNLPLGAKTISVSPSLISVESGGKQINAINLPRSTINGAVGNSDSVSFSGDDANQILRVSEDSLRYSSSGFWSWAKNINQSTHPIESGGFDRVILTDTAGDDTLVVDQETATLSSSAMSHTWKHLDNLRATSSNGGTDTATVTNPSGVVTILGDWSSSE